MNGWKRLWIVACALVAIPVFMLAESYWPTKEAEQATHYENARSNELALSIIKTAMEYPGSSPGVIDATHNYDQATLAITQESENYKEKVNSLWSRQIAVLVMFPSIWIAVCGMLYLIGMIGGWVLRGFRPKE